MEDRRGVMIRPHGEGVAGSPFEHWPARTPEGRETTVDVHRLRPGPYQRVDLTDDEIRRVRWYREILAEVDRQTLAEDLDNLRRDCYPEQELLVWERIAAAYLVYVSKVQPDHAGRQYAFDVLVIRSGQSAPETIETLCRAGRLRWNAPDILTCYPWAPLRMTVGG
jgi:hypothetical protein